jgi:hypothetical protein
MGAGKSNVWAVEPKMQVENPTGGGGMAKTGIVSFPQFRPLSVYFSSWTVHAQTGAVGTLII